MENRKRKHYYAEYAAHSRGREVCTGCSDFFCDVLNLTTVEEFKRNVMEEVLKECAAQKEITVSITFMQLLDE